VTEPRSFQEADEYLKLILEPEWFERVWVVQEACLANQLFFHYGKIIISMNRLHEVLIQRLKYPHTAALVDRRQKGRMTSSSRLLACCRNSIPSDPSSRTAAGRD